MKTSELRAKLKKDMGWRWYWMQFTMLFDLDWQYQSYLDRRFLYHIRKTDKYRELIKKNNERYENQ